MSNTEKLFAIKAQIDDLWTQFILMSKSQDPVAKLHHQDIMEHFSDLIVELRAASYYED